MHVQKDSQYPQEELFRYKRDSGNGGIFVGGCWDIWSQEHVVHILDAEQSGMCFQK